MSAVNSRGQLLGSAGVAGMTEVTCSPQPVYIRSVALMNERRRGYPDYLEIGKYMLECRL